MGMRVCSSPGCPVIHAGQGRCPDCRAKADKTRRPDGNPYSTAGHLAFREAVLARNPRCVCPGDCERHKGWCGAVATVADHYPIERRDLVSAGLDPNDPSAGRGVCKGCHDAKTARTAPGGWADRA
jgi:5-methylcytosine-specific restriction enzyme A